MKLRKILPLIAVLLLMLVAIPLMVVSASAEDALTPSEGLEFKLSGNKKYYIVAGIGDFEGSELVIPSTYEGKPVERIAQYAFRDKTQLTSVYLPDSINYVGHAVFYNCTNITSARLSAGLKTIGSSMFQKCSKLTSIVIPEGVTAINKDAFRECTALAEISLPSTLQSISQSVFRTNKAMTSITLPNSVTFVDHAAFYGCTQLRTVVIPGSVKNIPTYAFYNCGNLRSVTFGEGVESIGNYAMAQCPFLNTVNLPDSLTTIGLSAFRMGATQTSRLKAITIPANVTSIGNYAFFKGAITEINIPASVNNIGNNAFSGCNALKTVYYGGANEAAWNNINLNSNALLIKVTRYYYSENDPHAEGYWHYVNGVPTVWEVVPLPEFTVSFNANGHGTAPEAQTVVEGQKATNPGALTAEDYEFIGWYTDAACTEAYDFNTAVTTDITLYAKWVKMGDFVIGGDPESGDLEMPEIGI